MKTLFRFTISIIALGLLLSCSMFAPKVATQQQPTPVSNHNQFGVYVSQDVTTSQSVNAAQQLGVGWVRLNFTLGAGDQTYPQQYLASGINVVLTILNQDPANIVTDYGTPQKWFAGGFPYISKEKFQQDIRSALQPELSYIKSGRQVWVQGGNEIFDASVVTAKSYYWRGTMDQYMTQQQALYEAVKAVDPDIPVVLASFSSATLDQLIDSNDPGHKFALKYVTEFLTQGKYDAIDLHFYGCVDDIPAKVKAVKDLLPAGKSVSWISTENGGPVAECKSTPISWTQDLKQFENLQAQQVPARLSACAEQGGSVCMWFSLFNIKRGSDTFNHLGLIDQDANPPRQKPAYDAFKAFITQQK